MVMDPYDLSKRNIGWWNRENSNEEENIRSKGMWVHRDGYVRIESLLEAFENLSFALQQLADAKQQLEETKWECRNLEAENAALRKCVKAADAAVVNLDCPEVPETGCCPICDAAIAYHAARAEVDK